MNMPQSITDFQCSARNCIYFEENKFEFASEQNRKPTLTEDSTTSFWGRNSILENHVPHFSFDRF